MNSLQTLAKPFPSELFATMTSALSHITIKVDKFIKFVTEIENDNNDDGD